MRQLPFIDLQSQQQHLKSAIDNNIQRILAHGQYIMGPEVAELEEKLAAFVGAEVCVSCANGTDALKIPLLAWGIGRGDAVFTPAFTFTSTAEVVALIGAEPVLTDVHNDTFNMDSASLETAILNVLNEGRLTPRAIIAVDLFGQLADYEKISEIARKYDLKLISDSAQAFGGTLDGKHPLAWADVATTSFYPAKPLGCYGDGGAVFLNGEEPVDVFRSIRNHGQCPKNGEVIHVGLNSRLDTIQAAILLAKLDVFPEEIEKRNFIAARYRDALHNIVETPFVDQKAKSVWAQYTIKVNNRDEFAKSLDDKGVPTAIHYRKPVHLQPAYSNFMRANEELKIAEEHSKRVLSLPMHPYLSESDQNRIISAIRSVQV